MKTIWFMRRLIEKCWRILKYTQLSVLYHPDGFVHILGKVYLNNPNIKFGRNVTLYPNVHIFGPGKVTLEDNVSIWDGTIICARPGYPVADSFDGYGWAVFLRRELS